MKRTRRRRSIWRCPIATRSSASGSTPPKSAIRPASSSTCFARARDAGFFPVAHAGEEGPAQYVWEALDILGVGRVDHGNRSLDDPALIARLARERMALTMCPLSNLRLKVVHDLAHHPLRRMLEQGVKATVNSDDPAYFGGYVNQNFLAVGAALKLGRDEIIAIVRNGFDASLMTQADKDAAHADIDRVLVNISL